MRGILAALGLCLWACGPGIYLAATPKDDCCSLRSPTLRSAAQDNAGSVPQREAGIPRIEPAEIDLGFPQTPSPAFVEAVYPQNWVWRENLPMPKARPAATVLLLAEARASLGKGPRQLGTRRDLWCADFINVLLRRLGLHGSGSDAAASFAHWGKPAKPAPGVVAVKPRRGGNHVIVIKEVRGRTIIAISGNSGRTVREMKYSVGQFYAFRAPA